MKNAFVSWFVTDVLLAPFHELICLSKLGRPMGMYKSKLQSDDSSVMPLPEKAFNTTTAAAARGGGE